MPLSWRWLGCRAAENLTLWLVLCLAPLGSQTCAGSAAARSNVTAVGLKINKISFSAGQQGNFGVISSGTKAGKDLNQ